MNRELEALLKIWDEFIQTPAGPRADELHELYFVNLDKAASSAEISKDTLHRSVLIYHRRLGARKCSPGISKNSGTGLTFSITAVPFASPCPDQNRIVSLAAAVRAGALIPTRKNIP